MLHDLKHLATISTPRPCNCLLASASLWEGTSRSYRLKYACYDLGSKTEKVKTVVVRENQNQEYQDRSIESRDPCVKLSQVSPCLPYQGAVGDITISASKGYRIGPDLSASPKDQAHDVSFPFGVFDSVWVSPKLVAPFLCGATSLNQALYMDGEEASSEQNLSSHTYDVEPFLLLASCTDGSARFIDPLTNVIVKAFRSIDDEMLTSCTPFISSEGSFGQLQLLCTAHKGGVVVYDLAEERTAHTLEGHEFDAWCGAVWPSCIGTSSSPLPFGIHAPKPVCEASHGVPSPCISSDPRQVKHSYLLLSGGDDALLRFYDLRCSTAYSTVGKMRFDAGVVSISPVLQSAPAGLFDPIEEGQPPNYCQVLIGTTPYLLVGSYDESISLIDVRYRKRPVAQRGNLGGGVWRTSRCLFPVRSVPRLDLCDHPTRKPLENSMLPDSSIVAAPRNNYELFEQNTSPLYVSRGAKIGESNPENLAGSVQAVGTQLYVTQKNVLFLPLMQRGAAFLSYDVTKAEDEVFATPQHFFMRPSSAVTGAQVGEIAKNESEGFKRGDRESMTTCLLRLPLPEQCLIYDTAVLGLDTTPNELAEKNLQDRRNDQHAGDERNSIEPFVTTATVATCSFYAKQIDIWCTNKIKFG